MYVFFRVRVYIVCKADCQAFVSTSFPCTCDSPVTFKSLLDSSRSLDPVPTSALTKTKTTEQSTYLPTIFTMGRQDKGSSASTSMRITRSRARIIDLTEDNSSLPQPSAVVAPDPAPKKRGRKRKVSEENNGDGDSELVVVQPKSTSAKAKTKGKARAEPVVANKPSPKKQKKDVPEEKRLSRWRTQPPQQLRDRIHRCLTQRMVVLDRERDMDSYPPQEKFQIAGSTGNVYRVHIKNKSTCDCPDGIKVGTPLQGNLKNTLLIVCRTDSASTSFTYVATALYMCLGSAFRRHNSQCTLNR